MTAEAVKVFFSYSHQDEIFRDELAKHLKILERHEVISGWHDRKILPGEEWDHQIDENLQTADIILLLISSDFIGSNYCWDVEVKIAMQRHEVGNAVVIPIILRRVDWSGAVFSKLQFLPKNADPVASWVSRDDAYHNITQGIRVVANELIQKRQKQKIAERKQAASQHYRQKVEEFATDGLLSQAESFILKKLQQSLQLTDEEAKAVEKEIFDPLEKYQQNLIDYRKFVIDFIEQQGEIVSEKSRLELKKLQYFLKLKDEDVSRIEREIIDNLKTYSFEIVIVNRKGEITKRENRQAEYFIQVINGVPLEMIYVPGGTFLMGTEDEEIERLCKKYYVEYFRWEKPQHQVTVPPFYLGKYPITQQQWKAVASLPQVERELELEPSRFKDSIPPVYL